MMLALSLQIIKTQAYLILIMAVPETNNITKVYNQVKCLIKFREVLKLLEKIC